MQTKGRQDHIIEQAVALARDAAPNLTSILITHYPDIETLDTFRPGETDLGTVAAVNKAVATELAAAGVRVFVQLADRAAFRRWMSGRPDTQENRWAWRDRRHLLHGAAALKALSADPTLAGSRPKLSAAPGSLADRLLDAFADEDSSEFDDLVHDLLAAGRSNVLDLAVRKTGDRLGEEAAEDLLGELLAVAEGAEMGPSGWAELVALPVALPASNVPDAAALRDSLLEAGVLPATDDVRFLPGWRSPEALDSLDPAAVRRVLIDMVAGAEPNDLPPADADKLAGMGFGFLLGLQVDWSIPLWDEVAVNGPPQEPEEDEATPEDAAQAAAFDRWRSAVFDAAGCVVLDLVRLSEVPGEITDFLADAGQQVGGLEEIRAFVAAARREAPDEEVVCRPEIIADGLELSLYTQGGRFLSSMVVTADKLPAKPEEILLVVGSLVPLAKDVPGR
ncbi:conserved protein of unknown function (plasmid) [Rhodovastum atsumiense]|uniref:Uncharacterized protein n=1 Tax=Rhodovastum atsumiense TaxID=504468 RepID=A0A5M6IJJ8_9PROT|nr:hypothetical protein [Rhodovastum atsumiense]KAA5608057.1 hypothetical protein F1189_30860 [Rhodovastum atsumiense]CAH2605669.1 conserved protein of unknown function [Rhodovastum atsumiense]